MSKIIIGFEVDEDEFKHILELKGLKTWRELFLNALEIQTSRRISGPKRKPRTMVSHEMNGPGA